MPQQVIVVPFSGQLIGQGYNSETGENVGTALEVDSVFEDTSTDAQAADTSFELATTQDSLLESLGVTASADARVGLFSGGAKMSFTQDHAVNSSSTYVAGRTFVQNAVRHGKGFRLNKAASELLAAGNLKDFKTAFGDRFVRSLNTGGEFCIIARITSISESHQSKLATSLQGEYQGLITDVSFSAALSAANQDTHGQTDVTVKMFQSGGQGAELSFTGQDATVILERFKELPQFVHDHASGLEAELASYDTIPLPIPSVELQQDRAIVLNDCAAQKTGFLKAISDLELASEPAGRGLFDDSLPSSEDLVQMQGQYRAALNGLMAHAIRISTGEISPPQDFIANPAPPPINFRRRTFSPASPAGPPPLDSVTEFALFAFYPAALGQLKTEIPHSTAQAQSDAALGIAWNRAIGQATANSASPGVPPFIADVTGSPIQQRASAKAARLTPDDVIAFGLANFPDLTPDQAKNGAPVAGSALQGRALRQAMAELGEDVSKITFP